MPLRSGRTGPDRGARSARSSPIRSTRHAGVSSTGWICQHRFAGSRSTTPISSIRHRSAFSPLVRVARLAAMGSTKGSARRWFDRRAGNYESGFTSTSGDAGMSTIARNTTWAPSTPAWRRTLPKVSETLSGLQVESRRRHDGRGPLRAYPGAPPTVKSQVTPERPASPGNRITRWLGVVLIVSRSAWRSSPWRPERFLARLAGAARVGGSLLWLAWTDK